MEKWIEWNENVNFNAGLFSSISSIITEDEIALGFDYEDRDKIYVKFKNYLACREIYDTAFMKTLDDIKGYTGLSNMNGKFFIVENSKYIESFIKQSTCNFNGLEVKHYIIVGFDMITEVLSTTIPIIEIMKC